MSECPKHGPYSTPHCRECDLDIIANVESEEPTMPSEMVERCARADRLEAALTEIQQWADAYPETIFREVDLKRAASVLGRAGISMDGLHGSWARHIMKGVGDICRTALKDTSE